LGYAFACSLPSLKTIKILVSSAREYDEKFEAGEDVLDDLDLSKAARVNQKPKRVNVDFPLWMVQGLDKRARRLGVPRQSLVKICIAGYLGRNEPFSPAAK
jgi:hypothetical protein